MIEAVALYWPMALAGVLYVLQKESSKNLKCTLTAGMMASAWVAATLPWLNDISVNAEFWSFQVEHGYSLKNLPLSLYVGWILLWGVVPAFLLKFLKAGWIIAAMILLDVFTMGLFSPVMKLTSSSWLWGEALLVIISLVPAVFLAKWVIQDELVGWRATLISAAFVMLILIVLPTCNEAVRVDLLGKWKGYSLVGKCLWIILLLVVSMPGVAGVMEFSKVGKGTPIPYDAPKNLVTSGVYTYIQNPMQLSMVLVLLVWGWMMGSWFVVSLGLVAVVYSVGIARWSESVDLEQRYGDGWRKYDAQIDAWKCRLTPVWIQAENASIYVDADCSVCHSLGIWITKREPISLDLHPASEWRGEPLKRITYVDPNTGEKLEGVLAMGKVFQHMHLGWAWLGWVISLPGLAWLIQHAIDAGGGGKQGGKI